MNVFRNSIISFRSMIRLKPFSKTRTAQALTTLTIGHKTPLLMLPTTLKLTFTLLLEKTQNITEPLDLLGSEELALKEITNMDQCGLVLPLMSTETHRPQQPR